MHRTRYPDLTMAPPTTLLHAIHAGDTAAARACVLANPALLHAADPKCFGATPLIHAVNTDNRAMVDLLLDLGADINQRSDWWAGGFGVLDSASDELAEHLLARGATLTPHAAARLGKLDALRDMLASHPDLVHARGGDGQTPLHFARTPEIADVLLVHGADINALDTDHASTPAQWLGESRPLTAAHLVARGASPDPFMAARVANLSLLERLVRAEPEGANVRVSRKRFPVPPPAAGHIYLYTIGEGCTPLHAAALAEQPGSIRCLATLGADLNARGGYDDGTPLHTASWNDKPRAIDALLDAGADINAPSGPMHRNEPVGWAIVGGSVHAARLLIERGAPLRAAHREDAARGARGEFRQFNPKRPIETWQEIARLVKATA